MAQRFEDIDGTAACNTSSAYTCSTMAPINMDIVIRNIDAKRARLDDGEFTATNQ